MVKGNKIHLTKVERENIEQLREWRNNPELRKYFRTHRFSWIMDSQGHNVVMTLVSYKTTRRSP